MGATALILEGGGMRGLYTAGVLDLFLDKGWLAPAVYGVSAGACHACSYLSGQRGRAKRTVVDYLEDPRYAGVRSFVRTRDYFGVQMIYDEIPNRLLPYDYEAYNRSQSAFWAVATDCETGQAAYLPVEEMRRDLTKIQASSSLPLLSRMVEVEGRRYLDGGLSDSIPLAKAVADGFARHVVVLTQHRGFRKEPASMMGLMRLRYRKYPALVECMGTRHLRYNQSLDLVEQEEEAGRAVVIQPREPVTISRLEKDKDKLEALYRSGYEDAAACWRRVAALAGLDTQAAGEVRAGS